MRYLTLPFFAFAVALAASGSFAQRAKSGPKPKKTPVYQDVAGILKVSCVGCHTGARPAHGLNLTTFALIMKGDQKGKVVVPKNPASSRLSTVLHGKPELMPPAKSLPASQIAVIEAWIKAGAREK